MVKFLTDNIEELKATLTPHHLRFMDRKFAGCWNAKVYPLFVEEKELKRPFETKIEKERTQQKGKQRKEGEIEGATIIKIS